MYNSSDVAARIKEISKLRGISVRQLLMDAGLGYNMVTMMRTSMPKADNLAKLADALHCSVDYLLGRVDAPENVCSDSSCESQGLSRENMFNLVKQKIDLICSDEAADLAKRYDALDPYGKGAVQALVSYSESRLDTSAPVPEETKTKIIPLFLTPAAAGYVSPALGEDYEDYTVPADSQADFACKIQGDSMEPVIPDGSVVLVKRQIDMVPGDVGLFYVDGHMKCKQYCEDHYGNIYLFSLNRERRDADQTILASSGVSVYCFGKVILDKRPSLPRV